jgi:Helicase associated domain
MKMSAKAAVGIVSSLDPLSYTQLLTGESDLASAQSSETTANTTFQEMIDEDILQDFEFKSNHSSNQRSRRASFDVLSLSTTTDALSRKRKLSEGRVRISSLGSLDDAAFGLGSFDAIPGSSDGLLCTSDFNPPQPSETENVELLPLFNLSSGNLDQIGELGEEISHSESGYQHKGIIHHDDQVSNESSDNQTIDHGDKQLLLEALIGNSTKRRDRFESWGGMSDISLTMGSTGYCSVMGEIGETATPALQRSLQDEKSDFTVQSSDQHPALPAKISIKRERLYSVASLGEPSVMGVEEIEMDVEKCVVAAAMAEQLADIARVVETVTGSSGSHICKVVSDPVQNNYPANSVSQSTNSQDRMLNKENGYTSEEKSRSLSISSNGILVDYDAVAAAVSAVEAASASIDFSTITISDLSKTAKSCSLLETNAYIANDDRDMEAIRARARAAAGYIPPENFELGEISSSSCRKKTKSTLSQEKATYNRVNSQQYLPDNHTEYNYSAASKASSQKWDEMFECLLEFVKEQTVDTTGMTEKERKEVEWDGNVPTTYKTTDGKALGRWINNQRSAKHKGVLKKEREIKLMSTGLKWSVLSTNSWQDMMDELLLYVSEKTKDGSEWDGNVPTAYKIKGESMIDEDGEERNLGRWINRQRSLYQAGKLRKDRQMVRLHLSLSKKDWHYHSHLLSCKELEGIGLKWSVLSTTTWQSMFETLVDYVKERKSMDGDWDGNVPANFKTDDDPPKALGRWINRQRTARQKHKLKEEFVERLTSLGLKWSVHERRAVIPISQLATPIKSNVTSTKSEDLMSNQLTGACNISPAGKMYPDVVSSGHPTSSDVLSQH